MNIEKNAEKFVAHLQSLDGFILVDYCDGHYDHMGATISDSILQAGTKYETVVRPRINRIRQTYPEVKTTSSFRNLLNAIPVTPYLIVLTDSRILIN